LKALELDPTLAGPNAVLAGVAGEYDRDFAEAEQRFLRAIELNPNYASAHQWYAEILAALARHDDAVREIGIAMELDPLAPVVYAVGVWIYSEAGLREKTRECFERVREIDPGFAGVYNSLAGAYLRFGDEVKAIDAWTTWEEMSAVTDRDREDARTLRETIPKGKDAYWRELVEQHKRKRRESHYIAAEIAAEFAMLGEADSVIVWLEKGRDERTPSNLRLAVDARFDRIRHDERFQDIIRREGLQEAQERYLRRESPSS
jgi:tetratricopeptide (TPR) repeat protein